MLKDCKQHDPLTTLVNSEIFASPIKIHYSDKIIVSLKSNPLKIPLKWSEDPLKIDKFI